MKHAVEILQERAARLRYLIRHLKEVSHECCHDCSDPELKGHLADVTRAIGLLNDKISEEEE